MKGKYVIITILLFSLIILTSCPMAPSVMGGQVLVFGEHFLFDQYYDLGREIYDLNADGTFEYIGKSWNNTTGEWEQDWGARGTYTYDPYTFRLTMTRLESWEWSVNDAYGVIAESYTDNTDITAWSVTEYGYFYFSDNGMYLVYTQNTAGTWTSESGYSHTETYPDANYSYYNRYERTFDIDSQDFLYEYERTEKDWSDATEQETYQSQQGGPIHRLAPTGITWQAGNTVSFYYTNIINRDRDYDSNLDSWGAWNDYSDTSMRSWTLVHMGNYILQAAVASSKAPVYK